MKHYGMTNPEGSEILNLTAPSGTSNPANANVAELFFRTDTGRLQIHDGSDWDEILSAAELLTIYGPLASANTWEEINTFSREVRIRSTDPNALFDIAPLPGSPNPDGAFQGFAARGSDQVYRCFFGTVPSLDTNTASIYTYDTGSPIGWNQVFGANKNAQLLQLTNTDITYNSVSLLAANTDLGDLQDVFLGALTNGEVLSVAGGSWSNVPASTIAGFMTLNNLSDVNVGFPSVTENGYVVQWNEGSPGEFILAPTPGLQNIVEDTTPQLGGTLDANGFGITFANGTGISSAAGASIATGAGGNTFVVEPGSLASKAFQARGLAGQSGELFAMTNSADTVMFSVWADGSLRFNTIGSPVPATPTAGYGSLYVLDDKKLYFVDDTGTSYDLTSLAGLSDVDLTGSPLPISGDVLTYNGVDWIHATPAAVSIPSGSRITDSGGSPPATEETFIDTAEVANTITSNIPASGTLFQASEPFRASAAGGIILSAADATTSTGADGADIQINAGEGCNNGVGDGGSVTITAGRSSPGTFNGAGSINLTCSAASLGDTGGHINLTSGEGTRDGGDIILTTGDGNGSVGNGGDLILTAGPSTAPSGHGGSVLITSGNANFNGNSGRFELQVGGASVGTQYAISLLGPAGRTTVAAELRIHDAESNASEYIGFTVADNALAASITYTLPELPTGSPFPTQFLTTDASGVMSFASVALDPAGSDTYVQFNDGGVFGADAGLTYTKGTGDLTVGTTALDGTIRTPNNGGGQAQDLRIETGTSSGTNSGGKIFIVPASHSFSGTVTNSVDITGAYNSRVTSGNGGGVRITGGVGRSGVGGHVQLTGGDSNGSAYGGNINLTPGDGGTGSGYVQVYGGNNTTAGGIMFKEASSGGTQAVTLVAPASLTADRTWTLPDDDPAVVGAGSPPSYFLTTDASGNLSFALTSEPVTVQNGLQTYEYTATASQTTFSGADDNGKSLTYIQNQIFVYKNGVLLQANQGGSPEPGDYAATTGSTVVLNVGATADDVIQIVAYQQFVGQGATANEFRFTATAGQTSFSGADDLGRSLSYNAGDQLVYLNGTLLVAGTDGSPIDQDYVALDGSTITLATGATAGHILQVFEWGSFLIGSTQDYLTNFKYTIDGSPLTTTLTGADDNANVLAYSVGEIQVFLNGVLQEEGTDYTASTGTSVVLLFSPNAADVIQITAFDTFRVANHYTKSEIDNKYNTFSIQFTLPVAGNDTYPMQQRAQYGFVIDQAYFQTASGTIDADVQIGGVSVTGLGAMSVSSTEGSATATANQSVSAGDKVTLVTTNNSSANMLSVILYCTRT